MSNIYLICPVRGVTPEEQVALDAYVAGLEKNGHTVHYPPRDTDQTDDGCGLKICESHRRALWKADEVHVWWNPTSTGSHFDFGMAYVISRIRPLRFVVAGPPGMKPTKHKSYFNVFWRLASKHGKHPYGAPVRRGASDHHAAHWGRT